MHNPLTSPPKQPPAMGAPVLAAWAAAVFCAALLMGCGGNSEPAPAPEPPTDHAPFLALRGSGPDPEPDRYYDRIGARQRFPTLFDFQRPFTAPPPIGGTPVNVQAHYFNAGDLNLGRDMNCTPVADGLRCYVANHTQFVDAKPTFPDDPAFALASLTGSQSEGNPFATVAMEFIRATNVPPRTISVRECDGVPVPPQQRGDCKADDPPPIFVGEIFDGAPGTDVDSGVDLEDGDALTVTATGLIDAGQCCLPRNGPAGLANIDDNPKFPLHPGHPFGLIARVGNGPYFEVGERYAERYNGPRGRLYFRTNDDAPGNARGHFDVTFSVERAGAVNFMVYGADGELAPQAALDSEGFKDVPGVCLACHGGRYDPGTHTVTGASFLPFNLKSFKYSALPRFTRAAQEESFRRLNEMVKQTRPASPTSTDAITEFIDGSYAPSTVETAGAVARDDFVPPGWAGDANLYLGIVRPYCSGCHMALGPERNLDFTRLAHLTQRACTVQSFVFGAKSMPHSEVAFNHFWTDDLGLWPGVLAGALGPDPCGR